MMHKKQQIRINNTTLDETTKSNLLWRYSDLAKFLQVSECKLRRDVMAKRIPFIKIAGRSVRFDPDQIKQWLADISVKARG